MSWIRLLCITAVVVLIIWLIIAPALPLLLVVEKLIDRPDAVAILSGSEEMEERVDAGARLYFELGAPKVYLTDDGRAGGWNNDKKRNTSFTERAFDRLTGLGIPADAVQILPIVVDNTWHEANMILEFAKAERVRSIVIVTSDYHSRRALWSIERANGSLGEPLGIGIKPIKIDPGNYGVFWWIKPHRLMTIALEYSKLGYYRLAYQ